MNQLNQCRLFLINGFLGSGKTTLIKNLLQELGNYKVGLLENEFGDVGIDQTLFSKKNLEIVEIDNGSIFCRCRRDQFLEGLQILSTHNLDILFIESSGISDPAPMEKELEVISKLIGNVYRYEGNICVIDSINIQATLEVLESVRKQIQYSNIVLLNKMDLTTTAEAEKLKIIINEINPIVDIVETQYCKIPFNQIILQIQSDNLPLSTESYNSLSNRPQKILLKTSSILSKIHFEEFISHFASQTFRLKGYCYLTDNNENEWYFIDGVQSTIKIVNSSYTPKETHLVVILNRHNPMGEIIKEAWKDLISNTE